MAGRDVNHATNQTDKPTSTHTDIIPAPKGEFRWSALLLTLALTAWTPWTHASEPTGQAVAPKPSPAAARTSTLNEMKKLLQFVRHPARASIVELSRQFGFNYKVDVCHPVESADDWCWYGAHYARTPAAGIRSAGFGTSKRNRQPTGQISLDVMDLRVCFRPAELERVFGPGEHYATPMPMHIPGTPWPPLIRMFAYRTVPGGGSFDVEVAYQGECMSSVLIRF